MKYYSLLLLLVPLVLNSQTCPEETVTLVRQSQVDSFTILYPDCTEVEVDIQVGPSTDIANLQGLSNLQSCGRFVVTGNAILPNFGGLEQLRTVRNIIIQSGNLRLTSVDGLEGLESCSSFSAIQVDSLQNIDAITRIEEIEVLFCRFCPQLDTIIGFHKMDSVDYVFFNHNGTKHIDVFGEVVYANTGFSISEMTNLESFTGFEKLQECGLVRFSNNPVLQTIDDLSDLRIVIDLIIENNDVLQSISGFESLERVADLLKITDNSLLQSIEGFSVLDSIGNLVIGNQNGTYAVDDISAFTNLTVVEQNMSLLRLNIPNLDFLQSLTSIGQPQNDSVTNVLTIDSLANIIDLSGMADLATVNDHIILVGNDDLTTLVGLVNLDTSEVSNLDARGNPSLTDCANTFVCAYLQSGKQVTFANNGIGCNSVQEVGDDCDMISNATNLTYQKVIVYPNPASETILVVSTSHAEQVDKIQVYDMQGQQLSVPVVGGCQLDVSLLPAGVYQVVMQGYTGETVRFVKQ